MAECVGSDHYSGYAYLTSFRQRGGLAHGGVAIRHWHYRNNFLKIVVFRHFPHKNQQGDTAKQSIIFIKPLINKEKMLSCRHWSKMVIM